MAAGGVEIPRILLLPWGTDDGQNKTANHAAADPFGR
jgi:hypothetical protein